MPSHPGKRRLPTSNRKLAARSLLALGAVGPLLLAACSSSPASTASTAGTSSATAASTASGGWNATVQGANKEGSLVIFSGIEGTANAALQAAFEKAYPQIHVTITVYTPSNLTEEVDASQASHKNLVDYLIQDDLAWHQEHLSYFAPIVGPDAVAANKKLLNGATPITDLSVKSTQLLYEGNTLSLLEYAGLGYVWNKNIIHGTPSFQSLFAGSTYQNKVGIATTTYSVGVNSEYVALEKQYPGMFKRLHQLNVTLYTTGLAVNQAVAAGAIDVGFPSVLSVANQSPDLGFAYSYPVPSLPQAGEVLASAPHPDAAQVFANWMLTPTAQEILVKQNGSLPVIPVPGGLPANNILILNAANTPQLQAAMSQINTDLGR